MSLLDWVRFKVSMGKRNIEKKLKSKALVYLPQIGHGVAKALDLDSTQLVVHGKVGQVHVTSCFYRQSETGAKYEKLVIS